MTTYEGTIRTARAEIGVFCVALLNLDDDRERITDALKFIDDHGGLKSTADEPDYLENLIADLDGAVAQTDDVGSRLYDVSCGMSDADIAAMK